MPKNNKSILWILSDKKAKYQSQLNLASTLESKYDIYFLKTFDNKIDFSDYKSSKNFSNEFLNNPNMTIGQNQSRLLKDLFNNSPLGILHYWMFIQLNKQKIKKIFFRKTPKIIFLNSDRSGPGFETILLILARKYNIKIIIPYLSIINSGKIVRINNPHKYKLNLIGRILINSKYKFEYKSDSYCFYTISQYFALKFFNCLTENPFSVGNHPSTSVLCLDTPMTHNQISKNLTQTQKIRYVGRYEYNYLAKHQHEKKVNVLLSLPQLFEHNIVDWDTHIKFITEIIKIIVTDHPLIISLHPKSEYKNYEFLEKKYNCIITNKPIQNELVKSKLFICVNSSIAIWSTLLGIRTIILDFFDLDMSMFKNLETLKYVNTYDKLRKELKNEENIDYSQDWKILNKKELFSENAKSKMNQILETLLA